MTSTAISPLERIHRFIDELRARGVPVSMVERLDAHAGRERSPSSTGPTGCAPRCAPRWSSRPTTSPSSRRSSTSTSTRRAPAGPAQAGPADGQAAAGPGACRRAACCATDRRSSPVRSPSRRSSEYVQFEPGRPVAGVFYELSALAGLRLDELVAQQLAEAADSRRRVWRVWRARRPRAAPAVRAPADADHRPGRATCGVRSARPSGSCSSPTAGRTRSPRRCASR